MKRLSTIVLALLLAVTRMAAQPSAHGFSMGDLLMTTYPKDTSAAAVCLYSYESVELFYHSGNGTMTKVRNIYKKIKVLKEEGKSYANFVITHPVAEGKYEKIDEYYVTTYNMENGQFVTTQMSPKYLFTSSLPGNREKVSCTAENVKVGSVIEFSFTFRSDIWYDIDDIVFQMDIPVVKAEALISYPSLTNWNKMNYGYRKMELNETAEQFIEYTQGGLEGRLTYNQITDRIEMDDIQASHDEAFCYYAPKYLASIQYDLSECFSVRSGTMTKIQQSWEDVDKIIHDETFFKAIKSKSPFSKELDPIKNDKSLSTKDKVLKVIDFVRSRVRWNGENYAALCDIRKAIKDGVGNNVEINTLVASSLRYVGVECSPVMITLRDRGLLSDFQASVNSFNGFILSAKAEDGAVWYFDASLGSGYLNILSPLQLASKARLVPVSGPASWVDLTKVASGNEAMMVSMDVAADGSVSGNVELSEGGEDSFHFKNMFAKDPDIRKFTDKFFKGSPYVFGDIESTDLKNYSPACKAKASFRSEPQPGETIFVSPFIKAFHNPVDMPDVPRNCAIEMPYRKVITYNCRIKVPEGFKIAELPKSRSMSCPFLKGKAVVAYKEEAGTIIVEFTYSLGTMEADRTGYSQIRSWWKFLGDIYDDVIVFEKI